MKNGRTTDRFGDPIPAPPGLHEGILIRQARAMAEALRHNNLMTQIYAKPNSPHTALGSGHYGYAKERQK